MEVQRFPVVTAGIMILCLLIFFSVRIDTNRVDKQLNIYLQDFFEFYMKNPDLEIPKEFFNQFPKMESLLENLKGLKAFTASHSQEEHQHLEEKRQDELGEKVDLILHTINKSLLYSWGHLPKNGFKIFPLISHGFVHYGFFHLFSNMLLLWLVGCVIEDRLGRLYYALFYVSTVIMAGLVHSAIICTYQPGMANIPLIGASGGIAGLMGAFLVKMGTTRIKIFYFIILFFRAGTFTMPAYLVLPFWFMLQLIQGLIQLDVAVSNTAFWAHVGGFLYGLGIYLILRFSKLEKVYIAPAVEKKTSLFDQDLLKAMEYIDSGQYGPALAKLHKVEKNSKDPIVFSELSKLYFGKNEDAKASVYADKAFALFFSRNLEEIAVRFFLELRDIKVDFLPAPPATLRIIDALRKMNHQKESKEVCIGLFNRDKHSLYAMKSTLKYAEILSDDENNPGKAGLFLKKTMAFFSNNPEALAELERYYDKITKA